MVKKVSFTTLMIIKVFASTLIFINPDLLYSLGAISWFSPLMLCAIAFGTPNIILSILICIVAISIPLFLIWFLVSLFINRLYFRFVAEIVSLFLVIEIIAYLASFCLGTISFMKVIGIIYNLCVYLMTVHNKGEMPFDIG